MILCYALDGHFKLKISNELQLWIYYLLICFFLSPVLDYTDWIISSLINFTQRLVLCFMVIYVCLRDKSIKFGIHLVSFLAIVTAILILLKTDNYAIRVGYEGSINTSLSTNDLGALFAFACAATL